MLPTRVRSTGRQVWVSPFDWVRDDLDRWFSGADTTGNGVYPVDIREDEDHVYVEAELPGFTPDQVDVTFENRVLSIVAERKPEPQKGESHLAERRFTRVARSFTIPNTVDEQKIDAKLDNGVLHLTLHKREEVKPRKIAIN